MRASVYREHGSPDVLELEEIDPPTPRRREVLVEVHAAALNPKDVLVRKGKFRLLSGRRFPRIPGYDFAGIVRGLGAGARGVSVGDPVYGMVQAWHGGTCAELMTVPDAQLAPKPPSLSMVQAAAVPLAALTSLQALHDVLRLRAGDRVAINGASGGVGTFAVQIARHLGGRVTAICSARNLELVRELGAHELVDYTKADFLDGSACFDAVFDVFGNRSLGEARQSLSPRGRYCTTVPKPKLIAREGLGRLGLSRERLVVVQSKRADLERLSRWIEAGRLRPVVERVLPLEQAAEGHRHLETKRARGKIVLQIRDDGPAAERKPSTGRPPHD